MFIQRVKQVMSSRGLAQADLVRLTGISRSGVSQYLSGKSSPSKKALEKIAAALGVTVDWLTESDTPKITVSQAAELMGIDEQSLRVALQQKALPFGSAWKAEGSSKYTYYIYPKKFTEYTGIKL